MFNFIRKGVMKLNSILNREVGVTPDNLKVLEKEVEKFKLSKQRNLMIKSYQYYNDNHDILRHKRMVIGEGGELEEVKNLPNYKIADNMYASHIDKKIAYLCSKPFTIKTDDEKYNATLNDLFDSKLKNKIKLIYGDTLKAGVGYLFPYYKNNKLEFMRLKPYEVKVYYKDSEEEEINFFFRYYTEIVYVGGTEKEVEYVDVYTLEGVKHYRLESGRLYPREIGEENYIRIIGSDGNVSEYNWQRIPLVIFKYNEDKQILFNRIKCIQDAINLITSTFQNTIMEDARNTILILKNYPGEDLGEFRRNLMQYGAVKILDTAEMHGGVETLKIEIETEKYKTLLEELKKSLIKNMKSVDVDELKSGTPNQMNIQAMYTDIDQDANNTEAEIQASLVDLMWFVKMYLSNIGVSVPDEKVDFIFNKDMLQDESQIIDNVMKMVGFVSDETLLAELPFIENANEELEKVKKQKDEELDEYQRQDIRVKGIDDEAEEE